MIVHLGRRVSALLDGQLSSGEAERAWQHVLVCHPCRDLVETEGRIKTQLAGLSCDRDAAPSALKGSLLGNIPMVPIYPDVSPVSGSRSQQRVTVALVGTSALGLAMLGALMFAVPLGQTPPGERRLPTSDLTATTAPQPERIPVQSPAAGTSVVDPAGRLAGPIAGPSAVTTVVQRVRSGHHLVRHATHAVK
jgi:hypothetical protein